jgi:hypothetical protein
MNPLDFPSEECPFSACLGPPLRSRPPPRCPALPFIPVIAIPSIVLHLGAICLPLATSEENANQECELDQHIG